VFWKRKPPPSSSEEVSADEGDNGFLDYNNLGLPCAFSQLGGFRPPNKNDRLTSWWGGNFSGLPDEAPPVCRTTGHEMHPVLQIRVSELGVMPDAFRDTELLTLWLDLRPDKVGHVRHGESFCVRTYQSTDGLVPVGPGYREHATFPVFPIVWRRRDLDQPNHEDAEFAVSRFLQTDGSHQKTDGMEEEAFPADRFPVKVGGYPEWWQSSQWPIGGAFGFQIDSNRRGQLSFRGGLAHFFLVDGDWLLITDWP